ncbi:MAG: glycosyltransferase family 4 protein [Actinobacteria bacterium]|nr:glycosyltransferase family 4 protein [Actinomycetota bacterium]
MARRVAMGISFFPRGGSAQVVRYLAGALPAVGWQPKVFTGSLGGPEAESNAARFYAGLDIVPVDFTDAWNSADPMRAAIPLHPSFEDRSGAPDRVFTALDDDESEHQIELWTRVFKDSGASGCHLFHLHHLTAQHDAAARACPAKPVVAHLHGTELKMIDNIRRGVLPSSAWDERLVADAHRAKHIICISDHDRDEAVRLLGVSLRDITVVPNGVDTERFDDQHLSGDERLAHWRHWLLDEPLGWDESGAPGSRRCTRDEFDRFFADSSPVVLFVGRFLGFKRVPLLIRAYARARRATPAMRAPLVLWGGHPGEWEGEHPAAVVDELGIDGVFFVGWRGHDELPTGVNCADVMAAPSVDEPFGQVYLEAMACRRPVIATATGGPVSFVNSDLRNPNGWLVAPDNEEALADALVEAVHDGAERVRRGAHAYDQIRRRYAWSAIAGQFAAIYETARGSR